MAAFFETVLEPSLKAPFMRRSSGGAENGGVVFHLPSVPRVSRRVVLRRLAAAPMVLAALAAPPARASRKGDHDQARAAVQAGEVMPLPTLLERLQRTHPGRVLELELELEDGDDERAAGRKRGRWVYEIKLLQADGQLLKLEVDAATAEVLKVRRESARSDRKRGRDQPEPARAKEDKR